jgi:murein tripeptide amidase MpaA
VGVLVTGSSHAREWGGSDICVAFAANLLRAGATGGPLRYGGKTFSADQVQRILERLDLFVFADVNPDGKAFSQENDPAAGSPQKTWWRKNRNPNAGLGGASGVDVNRNFDFLWPSGIGSSADPASATYSGAGAFSEPEARNVRHLLDRHGHIAYLVDIHSSGELILYPWGDDESQSSDEQQNFLNPEYDGRRGVVGDCYAEFVPAADRAALEGLAHRMNEALGEVRGNAYAVKPGVGLYPTSGTSRDYAFSRHRADATLGKVYGYTIEFGREFVPPYAEMRNIIAEVGAALTELCLRAAEA